MEAVEVLEKRDALSDIVMWCGEEAGGAGGCLTVLVVGSRLLDLVVTQISHWYLSSPVALSVKCGQNGERGISYFKSSRGVRLQMTRPITHASQLL